MENLVDALEIAFAVIIFAMALTFCISSFSSANNTVQEIVNLRDTRTEYTYVTPSENLSRTVGLETIITSMYKAYEENFQIRFFDKNGKEIPLYYATDSNGKIKEENGEKVKVTYIDLKDENYASAEEAMSHLDFILSGKDNKVTQIYKNQLIYTDGLYKYLSGKKFIESLGEYYQGKDSTKIKKRIITYTETD